MVTPLMFPTLQQEAMAHVAPAFLDGGRPSEHLMLDGLLLILLHILALVDGKQVVSRVREQNPEVLPVASATAQNQDSIAVLEVIRQDR